MLFLSSGQPLNVTTGRDDNGDTIFNDRPAGVGRNSERTSGFAQFDLGLLRRVAIGGVSIEARAEIFNVFNRTNFSGFFNYGASGVRPDEQGTLAFSRRRLGRPASSSSRPECVSDDGSSLRMSWPRALLIGTVAAAIALPAWFLPLGQWTTSLAQYARDTGPAGVAVFFVAYVVSTVALLPGSILTLAAGFAYGPVWVGARVAGQRRWRDMRLFSSDETCCTAGPSVRSRARRGCVRSTPRSSGRGSNSCCCCVSRQSSRSTC